MNCGNIGRYHEGVAAGWVEGAPDGQHRRQLEREIHVRARIVMATLQCVMFCLHFDLSTQQDSVFG